MPRCSHDDVAQVLGTVRFSLEPFITAASAVVDVHLSAEGLPAALLTQIEIWLAAHFAAVRRPVTKTMSDGDTSTTWQRGQDGTGLAASEYGQRAMMLDPTGLLAGLNSERKRARIRVD